MIKYNSRLVNGETPNTVIVVVDVTEDDGREFTWDLAIIDLSEGSMELCKYIDLPGVDEDGKFYVEYLMTLPSSIPTDITDMTLIVKDEEFGAVDLLLKPFHGWEYYLASFNLTEGIVYIYGAVLPLKADGLIVREDR